MQAAFRAPHHPCCHAFLDIGFPYFLTNLMMTMLAKKTVKNQITLPKKIAELFPGVEYFQVRTEDDHIVLEPLRPDRALRAREKLAKLGIAEDDLTDAVTWARKRRR